MYMIYCELDSMVNCTAEQLNDIIVSNTEDCIKLNERVWFANIEKHKHSSYLSATEDFFYDHIEKYTNENSIFIIVELARSSMYNIPDSVLNKLVRSE